MINSYTLAEQVVAVGGKLVFNTNRILTGCTVKHTDGSPTFTLTKPGYYYVSFNTDTTSTATGVVTLQLLNGTEEVPGATASTTIITAGNIRPLSFSTIIRVLPSCCAIDNTTNLSIVVDGIEATITNANINITKLC